jgi:putative transposase
MIEKNNPDISVTKQCDLLGIHRSGVYYEPVPESEFNLELMKVIDKEYQKLPFYGVPRMTEHLIRMGYSINEKRISRLYHIMALRAIYPQPKTSTVDKAHEKYPYLLRDLKIIRRNQVWAIDITYIPMKHGFMYVVAIIDLYSRYIVGWAISNTLEADFCMEVLTAAIRKHGKPQIFNSDQGSQFTCKEFTGILKENNIEISMDGKGRAIDNIFIERFWRSLKYENIYLYEYKNGIELFQGLKEYFMFYNNERVHQSLDYQVPAQLYLAA